MKSAFLLLILAFVASAEGESRKLLAMPGKFVCPGPGTFEYWMCSAFFYKCASKGDKAGSKKVYTCPDNLVFDPATGACNYREQVAGCNPLAFCQKKGLVADPDNACSQFFLDCPGKDQMGFKTKCADNLYFNVDVKNCDYYEDTPACCNQACKRGKGNFPVKGSKNQYYTCAEKCGTPSPTKKCPPGQVFKGRRCVKA